MSACTSAFTLSNEINSGLELHQCKLSANYDMKQKWKSLRYMVSNDRKLLKTISKIWDPI